MRKVKVQVQMSIDGFVARPDGALDWIWIGKSDETILQRVIELADTCDTILLGRKMTRGFIDHWENVLDNHPESREHLLAKQMVTMRKIVFSRTQQIIKGRNLEVENGELATTIHSLKRQSGKDIMVYGGASFVSSLISQNLVDEYYIFRKPVAIGEGMPVFREQKVLTLKTSSTFGDGTILNQYLPEQTSK